MRTLSDRQLVELYQQGQPKAFELILERHGAKIMGKIVNTVRDVELAADVFQETMLKVVEYLQSNRYKEQGHFLALVYRIAHNECINVFRYGKKMPKMEVENKKEGELMDVFELLDLEDGNIEECLFDQELRTQLETLVGQLPAEQKEVVWLRMYAGLSFQEIADQTGVSINTGLGRMRYALINMRRMVEQQRLELMG
jgi:RNA polymerase sigma-70 factor, ECF subfamily